MTHTAAIATLSAPSLPAQTFANFFYHACKTAVDILGYRMIQYNHQQGGKLLPRRLGVTPITTLEVIALLNLLAVIIFGTVDITRKKK